MNKEELLNDFEAYLRADKKAEATIDIYTDFTKRFLSFVNGAPDDITTADIQRYKEEIMKLSASTIRLHLAAVKSFLECHENYASDRVRQPDVRRKDPVPLTREEVNRLLKSANNPIAHAVIATLFYTGMRVGSLLKLEFNHILWEEGKVNLRKAKRDKTYTVLMPPQAMDAIQTYRRFRVEPEYTKHTEVVFICPRTKQPYTRGGINHIVKTAAAKAGITKRVYPHLIRHTHGTLARKQGLPLDSIAKQLGHESIQTTQLYAQLADDRFEQDYQPFFAEDNAKQTVKSRRPTFDPDADVAYR